MIQPAFINSTGFKKGEGHYIYLSMFIGAFILIFHALEIIGDEQAILRFYQNLISGFILLGDAVFLLITKKLKTSINIGLGLLFVLYTLILIQGKNNPSALMWVITFPLLVFYSKNKKYGVFYSSAFLLLTAVITLLQHRNIITTSSSTAEYIQTMGAYATVFFVTYGYKDVIERKEKQIYRELNYCRLTNLPNRSKMIRDINKFESGTLILINVDDFKIVNNLYGASYGDKILFEISKRLTTLYNTDLIYETYKLHADEFALLLFPETDKRATIDLVNNIISRLSRNYNIDNMDIAVTVSIGVSSSNRDLLADADIALKTAKEKRLPFVLYNDKYKVTQKYHLNIQKLLQLKTAVLSDNIIPFFQPVVDNSDGKINKYECLVRLVDGNEILSPFKFLDMSKKAKFYPDITRAMIRKSFSMFCDKDIEFSLNIDLDDILNKETTELIYSKLAESSIAKNVVFELLESNKIDEYDEVEVFISKVKQLGAKIAIDDFGSGYSNFEYILKLKVDYIKIDASLIKNITTDLNSQIITETIVTFCKKLNIKTIAEFVHSEEIYRKVKSMGIDYSQGYHLGEPSENI